LLLLSANQQLDSCRDGSVANQTFSTQEIQVMKCLLAVSAILVALCAAPAFADSITFTNQGVLPGSSLGGNIQSGLTGFSFNGIPQGPVPGMLVLSSMGSFVGSLLGGGTISSGYLEIDLDGFPGAIFASTFSGSWSPLGGGLFELLGTFSGDLGGGLLYHGGTDQVFQINFFHGQACFRDLNGTTTIVTSAVPEPGTLALLGTGLVGIAGAIRRKVRGVEVN
jgi:hypothetical protein